MKQVVCVLTLLLTLVGVTEARFRRANVIVNTPGAAVAVRAGRANVIVGGGFGHAAFVARQRAFFVPTNAAFLATGYGGYGSVANAVLFNTAGQCGGGVPSSTIILQR